jgi:AraC family transcriptional regulator, transcriptional activator of pobA
MKWQFEDKATQGRFIVSMGDDTLKGEGILQDRKEMVNTIVCNQGAAKTVVIDRISYTMPAMSVLPLVANQHFVFERQDQLLTWQFNRDFYCIADHDAEVGCVGFLFYGIEHPLFISLSEEELKGLTLMGRLCVEEMSVTDKMQGEMLRTLLKRLIINVTRIAKRQTDSYRRFTDDRMNVIRRFNLLLEAHFRVQHEVQFYAQTMNRSPKTLTNLFALCRYPAPSKLIQRRIILEAKRFLYYTDKSAKEVADELGFANTAHFSRFFKTNAGVNFSAFKS